MDLAKFEQTVERRRKNATERKLRRGKRGGGEEKKESEGHANLSTNKNDAISYHG